MPPDRRPFRALDRLRRCLERAGALSRGAAAQASSTSPHAAGREPHRGRREFLQVGALAGAAASLAGVAPKATAHPQPQAPDHLNDATIAELQAAMSAGSLTALALTNMYLARIEALDRRGPRVNAVLELNPDARAIARALDAERRRGIVRGALHGIPVLLKDNIDTADRMMTTAGSLALVGAPPLQDSTVAAKLRAAGAVILGKSNLSEWANFRSFFSSSGWSGRGGQNNNPYILDRNPCGSSSGTASAVTANFVAAGIGTETDGSIVCPASACGTVGLKPTVGLVSRAGVVPIAASQDTVGPHARTVADAAALLGVIASQLPDPRDPATFPNRHLVRRDYTAFVDPDGLAGARIGVTRAFNGASPEADALYEQALQAMQDAGATLVDPADLPTMDEIGTFESELVVLVFEFKRDLNAYLAARTGVPIGTLADAIAFNEAHAEEELKYFGQEWFLLAEAEPFDAATYAAAVARARAIGGPLGIDAVLEAHDLDALVAPTGSPAWPTDLVNGDHFLFGSSSPAAIAGYPLVTLPMGQAFGLPVGITFMGTAYSEPTLIRLASGFEHVAQARRQPAFLPTLPLDGPRQHGHGRGRFSLEAATRGRRHPGPM